MQNMQKKYNTLSTWADKQTHNPKSSLAEIKEGKNKVGEVYQITDTNSTMVVDGFYPVGTIISYTMTMDAEPSGKTATRT